MTPPQPPAKRNDQPPVFDLRASEKLLERGLTVLNADGLAFSKRPEVLWRFHGYGAHIDSERYRPYTVPVIPENIPQELKERDQWVAWDWVWRDGGWRKQPLDPITGGNAIESDSSTWGSFQEALTLATNFRLAGIGFVLSRDDPYVGIDLDNCIDLDNGELEPEAIDTLAIVDSYTEYSPSGTGLHIITTGNVPERRGASFFSHSAQTVARMPWEEFAEAPWPEIYMSDQFIAMTGDVFSAERSQIRDCQPGLMLLTRSLPEVRQVPGEPVPPSVASSLRILSTSATSCFAVTWDDTILRLDLSSGDVQWRFWLGDRLPETSPSQLAATIDGPWLSAIGRFADTFLIRVQDGKSAPWWQGDRIVAGGEGLLYAVSADGSLSAFECETGRQCWDLELVGPPAITFRKRVAYVAHGHALDAIDIVSGRVLWNARLPRGVAPAQSYLYRPELVGDILCVSYEAQHEPTICGFDTKTGEFLWHLAADYCHPQAAVEGLLLIHPGGYTTSLCAIDPGPPSTSWAFDEPGTLVEILPEIQMILVATIAGDLVALDAVSGKLLWRAAMAFAGRQSVTYIDGALLIWDGQHARALAQFSGLQIWQCPAETKPVVRGTTVYVARGSIIRALDLHSGAESWAEPVTISENARATSASLSPVRDLRVIGNILLVGMDHMLAALRLPD